MLVQLQKHILDPMIEDDQALMTAIKKSIGTAEQGNFHFELYAGAGEYITTRFKNNLNKVSFYFSETLNRPGVKLSMGVKEVAPAPVLAEVVPEVVSEEVLQEASDETKRKTRK
jgi:hypothetical protein